MAESNGKLISELKVHELRSELISRGLDGNGVKAALVARLEKYLSEQGHDINSYLFSSACDANLTSASTTSLETENDDAAAQAAAVAANSSKDETGKDKEEKEEAVPENVIKTSEVQKTTESKDNEIVLTSSTADVLTEKVEDEIDEAELHGESEDVVEKPGNSNRNGATKEEASPDIADLEEREESESDDTKNDESIPMETDSEKKTTEQQQVSAIHDISDEEDLDEDMLTDETTANQNVEKKEEEKQNLDVKIEPAETKVKEESKNSNKEAKLPAKPRIPAGLNFPSDDPNGLRCIWIRALPYETRLSELKLAFIDAGFTVESAKIFTTKQSSRPSAFGFMTLSSQDGAKKAVEKMNNSIFKGKIITVERASDASMLASSDLLPPPSSKSSSDRPKIHPPIKPPEDIKSVSESSRSRVISTTKSSRTYDTSHSSRSERRHSPYKNTIHRTRIIRTEPQRIVEASGRSIRVVASSRDSRSNRPSRHSPIRPPPRERERTPPRRHHRSPDHERRKYEDMMRKQQEEFKRKEEALRVEAERNRIKLEKERLEKENLELKLRLQHEQLRTVNTNVSSSHRGPSPHSTSRHRRNTPPPRRASPPRSSRHASPPRHPSSSRRSPQRNEPRHHTLSSSNYPPKEVYPARRRSRSRSPIRTNYDRSRPDEYSRSGRPQEHGSSRHGRPISPLRNAPPPPPKYERHSPKRNYESSSRSDRSRRNDKLDTAYPPIEEPQRNSRSSRNGGESGRDFSSDNYDRPSNGNSSFESTHREFIPPPQAIIPVTTYNLATDYRTAGNPSYSTTPGNSRNQIPATHNWAQQNYATRQPTWGHQPQNVANIPQWNPFNSSGGSGMRGNNSNPRYGGGF